MLALEEGPHKIHRGYALLRDVVPHIEGSRGSAGRQTTAIENSEQLLTPHPVSLAHLSYDVLRAYYGSQGRHLSRGVDARDDRLLHAREDPGQVGGRNQVAHA